MMRFPVAKLKLRVTGPDGKVLPGAIFAITSDSDTVQLTSDSDGECSIPVKLHDKDNIGDSAFLTARDVNSPTYVITETHPPEGYQGGYICSFRLNYAQYPSSDPPSHHTTWFRIDAFKVNSGEAGTYSLEKTVGDQDTFHVINKER